MRRAFGPNHPRRYARTLESRRERLQSQDFELGQS